VGGKKRLKKRGVKGKRDKVSLNHSGDSQRCAESGYSFRERSINRKKGKVRKNLRDNSSVSPYIHNCLQQIDMSLTQKDLNEGSNDTRGGNRCRGRKQGICQKTKRAISYG